MASTDKPADPEAIKAEPPVEAAAAPPTSSSCEANHFKIDVALRALLFAASVTSLVVMVTAKQSKAVAPGVVLKAKFNDSPAFIYFVVASCVSALYSLITALASFALISKPSYATKFLLFFALADVLILGIVAAATGTAGGVAYIGLKGNDHVRWPKVCNRFDKFCKHIGSSVAVSLFASVVLVLLSFLSTYSLFSRIPK